MRVLLADSNENDGLARGIDHVEGSADLLVNCVELGQNDSVNGSRVTV